MTRKPAETLRTGWTTGACAAAAAKSAFSALRGNGFLDPVAITLPKGQTPSFSLRPADGLSFHAGEGVGIVTKPGLPIPPGEPAINPAPRALIEAMLREIAPNEPLNIGVEISIPGGAEIAKQTWNGRLGIEGGLSILGTTGIVRPFSCSAWIASIHRGIDVIWAILLAGC